MYSSSEEQKLVSNNTSKIRESNIPSSEEQKLESSLEVRELIKKVHPRSAARCHTKKEGVYECPFMASPVVRVTGVVTAGQLYYLRHAT